MARPADAETEARRRALLRLLLLLSPLLLAPCRAWVPSPPPGLARSSLQWRGASSSAAAVPPAACACGRSSSRRHRWQQAATGEDELGDGVKEEERVGPGAPEGYWKDAENIKRELQVFFTVREAEEQRVLEQKKSNPLRSYLGLSDEEQKRIQRRDALIDHDLYSDLRRYGFDYLVLPVMEQGGFRVFAEMLAEGRDSPPRAEDNGGLALGRALEEKLSTLSETISADPPAATTTSDGPLSSSAPGVTRPGPVQDDPAALDPSAWRKGKPASGTAAVAARREPVDWSLSNSMKLYMALAALTLAVGFGKGTGGAIDRGVLTPETLESVRLAAAGAVVANLLSAPLSLLLLLQAGRPFAAALPMALKALMAGPAAVVEYRLTGQFERRDGAADGSGGGGIVGK